LARSWRAASRSPPGSAQAGRSASSARFAKLDRDTIVAGALVQLVVTLEESAVDSGFAVPSKGDRGCRDRR
jgi:hypothetical protein